MAISIPWIWHAGSTTDNGCGSSTTLACRGHQEIRIQPRCTRFVSFFLQAKKGLGWLAASEAHQSQYGQSHCGGGSGFRPGPCDRLSDGRPRRFNSRDAEIRGSAEAFGNLEVDDEAEFGTDTGPFIMEGLPGINLNQDSPDYKYTHHSAVDTFDKVKADVLDRNATVMALTGFWIADRPDRFASSWPKARTARMLTEKHDDVFLKLFGRGLRQSGKRRGEPELTEGVRGVYGRSAANPRQRSDEGNVGRFAPVFEMQGNSFLNIQEKLVRCISLRENIFADATGAPSILILVNFHFHEHFEDLDNSLRRFRCLW